MRDSLTSNTSRDFRARYGQTYGFYTTEAGKRILVKIQTVEDSYLTFKDADGMDYTSYANKGTMFEFLQVDRGWFNGANKALMLHRHPARQWQRGISQNNTRCLVFATNGTLINGSVDFPNLRDAFETNITAADALKEYRVGGRNTVALSKHFAIGPGQHLYLYNNKVADCDFKKNTIKILEPSFAQEINDINNRTGLFFNLINA